MNRIHPTALIDPDVRLGDGNVVGPYVVVTGAVVLGNDNWIGAGAMIGPPPEVRSFVHPTKDGGEWGGGVVIGDRTVIREGAQVHQGWKGITRLGDDCFVMNQVYIAHDCVLGDGVTLASSVLLAGHVSVGARANLGLGCTVHQGRALGPGAMIGMSSVVTRDVPPWSMAYGNPARIHGVNIVGAERAGVEASIVRALQDLYADSAPSEFVDHGLADDRLAPLFREWLSHR